MITEISVKNFRSIKDASIKLETLNVLVGANGAGKSTLLEGLNFARKVISGVRIAEAARIYAPIMGRDFFNYYHDGTTSTFSFNVQTKQDSLFTYSFSIGYIPDFNSRDDFYVQSEKLIKHGASSTSTVIFDRSDASNRISIGVSGPDGNQLPIEIENNRLFLSTLAHPDTKEVIDTFMSYEVIWADERFDSKSHPKFIVDNPRSKDTVDDILVSLSLKSKDRYEDAIGDIRRIIPEFEEPDIVNLSEGINSRGLSKSPVENTKSKEYRYLVNWLDSRHPNSEYSRFSISGGNLRVIYLILSLYNTESRACFVAEEIENGMHPGRVKRLVQVLIAIAKKRELQLMFTTHSYLLTSEVLPRNIVFCRYVDGEGSAYTKLTDTNEYKLISETLDSEPSTEDVLESGMLSFGA